MPNDTHVTDQAAQLTRLKCNDIEFPVICTLNLCWQATSCHVPSLLQMSRIFSQLASRKWRTKSSRVDVRWSWLSFLQETASIRNVNRASAGFVVTSHNVGLPQSQYISCLPRTNFHTNVSGMNSVCFPVDINPPACCKHRPAFSYRFVSFSQKCMWMWLVSRNLVFAQPISSTFQAKSSFE